MNSNKRLEWLDALRGITMILVVIFHVMEMSFSRPTHCVKTLQIIELMRMPLFFFISGFLAYKDDLFCKHNYFQLIIKKVKIQIPSTFIFFILYVFICFTNSVEVLVDFLSRSDKGGYWFTIVLFYFFVIYYSVSYLNKLLKNVIGGGKLIFAMWILSLILYTSTYLPSLFKYDYHFLNITSLSRVIQYMHVFFFGMIIRRYWSFFEKMIERKWVFPTTIIITTICTMELFVTKICSIQIDNIIRLLSIYLLIIITITCIKHYQNIFSQKTFIGRNLSYIGKHTLDIYLIHFILLPQLPTATHKLFEIYGGGGIIIEGSLYFIISMLIIGGCLLISQILRTSPSLGKFLFGR